MENASAARSESAGEATAPRPVILTGIQPTAGLQLGNYVGMLRNLLRLQEQQLDCLFFLADMHAITMPQVPAELRRNTLDGVALYLACGLDPKKSHIFVQSHVIGHGELAWVLGCLTSVGQLERMTQFKDKIARRNDGFVGAGLLYYPVLMAADILLYNADLVPVGEDQKQHLELARDIAQRFNSSYSETFKIPEPHILSTGARIMSLQDPRRKMSKSDGNVLATVFLTDSPDSIRKKIRSAVTDSGTEVRLAEDKPGVGNLLQIFSALSGSSIASLEQDYGGKNYGAFKNDLAEVVVESLAPIREKFIAFRGDRDYLAAVVEAGRTAVQPRACRMISKVYRKIGFLPPPNCHGELGEKHTL